MLLAFQLALCISFVSGSNRSDTSVDEECLLARSAAVHLKEDVPDYMKRWDDQWAKQVPLNLLKTFLTEVAQMFLKGILGDLVGLLFSAFWPSGSSQTKALLEFILQWTQDYVNRNSIKILNNRVRSDLNTMRDPLKDYKVCVPQLKDEASKASVFPAHKRDECLGFLNTARYWGRAAMNKVADEEKDVRPGAIANYLLATTSVMTVWSEQYQLMVFSENWKPNHSNASKPAAVYDSEEVRKLMEGFYKNFTKELKDIVDDFWEWRRGWISVDRGGSGLEWTDRLTGTKRSLKRDLNGKKDEVQDAVFLNLKRETFMFELAPMLKSYTTLHRLIPKRSKEPPARGPFFPKTIYLGVYSGFIMGEARADTKTLHTFIDPEMRETSTGSIWMAGGRKGTNLDLLEFTHGDGAVTKMGFPEGGKELTPKRLPPYTCGMEISYRYCYMGGIAFMNIKNQSMAIQGSHEQHGFDAVRFNTGPALCGLYTLHQFHRYPKLLYTHRAFTLGRGVELSFKWEPVTEDDF